MAAEGADADGFETTSVSRFKGVAFKLLSMTASWVGIVMLGVLMVYVSLDAFDLGNASPAWIYTFIATVVLPTVVFFVYSADDRRVMRLTSTLLAGGLLTVYLVFNALEMFVGPVPQMNWQLAYLFVVVLPTTGYAAVSGARKTVGSTGFSLMGRLVGGAAIGIAAILLFTVLDYRLWLLGYTLGLLPATGVAFYGRRNPNSVVSLLVLPTAVVGFVVATVLYGSVEVSASRFVVFVWTLALPVSVAAAAALRGAGDLRTTAVTAFGVLVSIAAVSIAASSLTGVQPGNSLLFVLSLGLPAFTYVRRMIGRPGPRVGLLFPVILASGIGLGFLVVETTGFTAPDPWLDHSFLTQVHSQLPEQAGFYPAIIGSVFIVAMVALFSFVLGVGTAVFLEDYAPDEGLLGSVARVIQINVANLAAVPSIVYGLLGLGVFVNLLGFGLGTGVTAALTLSLLILPITIISAREAVRSVPDSMRQASYAMGSTRWQTTKNVVLPEAMSGILTGVILALGRAIGETAPLIMIGAPHVVFNAPDSVWSRMSAMPMQIFVWSSSAQSEFRYGVLAAGVVTLLIVLMGMNASAIVLRNRSERGD